MTLLSYPPLTTMFPEFGSVDFNKLPFEHFTGHCMQLDAYPEWLEWFETSAPWKLTMTDFYEQYEFSLLNTRLASTMRHLACLETLASLRSQMSRCFQQSLSDRVDVTAHKLIAKQTIRIHNDFIPGGESHRLLLQLNRGWEPKQGGYLMFFGGPEPESINKIVEPQHGSIQAFAISPESYHAVSTVHGGERFTVVYSFFADSDPK